MFCEQKYYNQLNENKKDRWSIEASINHTRIIGAQSATTTPILLFAAMQITK